MIVPSFPLYEIEHSGDLDAREEEFIAAGGLGFTLVSADYDHEEAQVDLRFPPGTTPAQARVILEESGIDGS